jgi:glycosyltransferase involved in cell wall biosynthesis
VTAIGIDARAAAEEPAGRGKVVRELLRAVARRDDPHRYLLYTRRPWLEQLDERFHWRAVVGGEGLWHLRTARAANRECEVFLSTNSYLTPWFTSVPSAILVYDLVPFLPGTPARRRSALVERVTLRRALRRVSAALCISEATRADLVRLFPQAAAKASVVPLAADEHLADPPASDELEAVRAQYRLDRPFVLHTGTLEPRKNLVRLFDAFAPLRDRSLLVLAGPRGWDDDEIVRRAGELGDSVRLLGHVSDGDLAALYRLCEVFCYPSLYEGFGLPVLEAMQAGAPAITSRVSSLPEVGGDAAVYVDPTSVEDIRNALDRLLSSPEERAALTERGRRRAAQFSWQRTAEEILGRLSALAPS